MGSEKKFNECLLKNDQKVICLMNKEKFELAGYVFQEGEDQSWINDLEWDKKHKYILLTPENIDLIFTNDPKLKDKFYHDNWDNQTYTYKKENWNEGDLNEPRCINENEKKGDLSQARKYLASKPYGLKEKGKLISDCFWSNIRVKKIDSVIDHINSLPFTETFHHSILGPITRPSELFMPMFGIDKFDAEILEIMLIALCRCPNDPYCGYQIVVILRSTMQGIGKSSFFKALGGKWYYTATFESFKGREAALQMKGNWITEDQELRAIKGSSPATTKGFITDGNKKTRRFNKEESVPMPLKGILVGTTNEHEPLTDDENRRYVVIDCENKPFDQNKILMEFCDPNTTKTRDWVIAWGREQEKNGAPIHLSSEIEKELKKRNERFSIRDELEGLIEAGLEGIDEVCVYYIWCNILGNEKHFLTKKDSHRITSILHHLRWIRTKKKRTSDYGPQWVFVRPTLNKEANLLEKKRR